MLSIIHHPGYDARSVADEHRFPMRKYRETARLIEGLGLVGPYNAFIRPEAATAEVIGRAHSPDYVEAIFTQTPGSKLARQVGFDITPEVVLRSRLSCAGSVLAGHIALDEGIACNVAGGSHHAGYSYGAGFCVFNDVAVAIRELQSSGRIERAMVIDCDVHQGDGTAQIFAGDQSVFTFSQHCEKNWPTRKVPSDLDIGLEAGIGDASYLEALKGGLDEAFLRFRPDLVFYNAGVDPHIHDRLGKFSLSDEGIRSRERLVLRYIREKGFPVVGVMGGGYSRDVMHLARLHLFLFPW